MLSFSYRMSLFIFFFLSSVSWASQAQFTTIFYDDGGVVFVGVKSLKETESFAHLVTFPFEGGEQTSIKLPPELENRDLVGLIPERKKLFVLSQRESEKLMLHRYNMEQEEWKKIGQVECPTFTKVKTAPTKVSVFCESTGKKRGSGVQVKNILLGKERLFRTGTWRFPEFLLRYKGVTLLLEGNAPAWNRLRLKSASGDRVIQAEDLVSLPETKAHLDEK